MGGWAGGKTHILCRAAQDVGLETAGSRIAIIRKIRADIEETTYSEFLETIDQNLIMDEKKSELTIYLHTFDHRFPTEVRFKGVDDIRRWGSTQYSHMFIEEANELSHNEYIQLRGRLRYKYTAAKLQSMVDHNCRYIYTYFNNDGEEEYEVNRFIVAVFNPQPLDHWLYRFFEKEKSSTTTFTKVSTYENFDNLPEDYRRTIESTPDSHKSVKVAGEWGNEPKGKPCTPSFNRVRHIISDDHTTEPTVVGVGIDFGYKYPAWSIFTIDGGLVTKWYEILLQDTTLDRVVDFFFQKIKPRWHPDCRWEYWCDHQAAKQHSSQSENTNHSILLANGIFARHKYSRPKHRAQLAENLFKENRFLIHRRCSQTIVCYGGGYYYPEGGGDDPEKDPMDPNHNVADADLYFIFGKFGPVEKVPQTHVYTSDTIGMAYTTEHIPGSSILSVRQTSNPKSAPRIIESVEKDGKFYQQKEIDFGGAWKT